MTPKPLERIIQRRLFTTHESSLSFDRLLDAIGLLAELYHEREAEEFDQEGIEYGASTPDILIGAYWFCSDYHGGQSSDEYALLCRIGEIYQPGMTAGPEPESSEEDTYHALELAAPYAENPAGWGESD